MSTAVVSTRIKKRDKDTLKEAGIDVSAELRRHLEQIAAEIRARKSLERLNKTIDRLMPPARQGYAKRSVREDRESN
ncbi:MAG: VapB-type antitoxin [Nitrososphaerota archaeon]|nr:VapB-type antitoxin [Nitrososphaerota archaeon]